MYRKFLKTVSAAFLACAMLPAAVSAAPVTIRIVEKDLLSTNPEDVAHIKRIEEAMAKRGHDIRIQIVNLPSSGYVEALGVMLLSGDMPDLIYFQGGDEKFAAQGVLEDLRPWIAKTTYLKDALYPHNVRRLENYPYLLYVFPLRARQPVIRTDWLEKSGMASPQSIDEYVKLFKALRDGDYDGNGKKDTFGITAAGNTSDLDGFMNPAFGVTATWLKDESGKWVHSQVSRQERDKLVFYNMLYKEGLLNPEFVTANWEAKEDQFYTGRAGVVAVTSPNNVAIYQKKMRQLHPNASLTLLGVPEGPGGRGLQAVSVAKETRGFAISVLSKHKEEVVALLDFMASPEGQMLDRMGFEGTHYTRNGDTYTMKPEIGAWYARFMEAANWKPPVEWRDAGIIQYIKNTQDFFIADNLFTFPSDYGPALDAAINVYNEWAYRFISGKASFDDWNKYVAAWMAAGGDKLTTYAETKLK